MIIETSEKTIESQIAAILSDIRQKGYSSVQPFNIGKVEARMIQFAQANAITLASDELYISAKQLQHCMRASKATKGLVVADADMIGFLSLPRGSKTLQSSRCLSTKKYKSWSTRGQLYI